jgi:hypothetical protein
VKIVDANHVKEIHLEINRCINDGDEAGAELNDARLLKLYDRKPDIEQARCDCFWFARLTSCAKT